MSREPRLVVLQLVTSGLYLTRDALLEVAAVAISRPIPHVIRDKFEAVVSVDLESVAETCDPELWEKFEANGLLEAVLSSVDGPRKVDAALASWLDNVGAAGEQRTPLITFGPDWARPWLNAYLPKSAERICDRDSIDLGALLRIHNLKRRPHDGRAASMVAGAVTAFAHMASTLPNVTAYREGQK